MPAREHQRDQLHYDISKHYLELGQTERAIEKLTNLMGSNQTFWQTAAKQQLDYIQLEPTVKANRADTEWTMAS